MSSKGIFGLSVLDQGLDAAAVTPSDTTLVGPTRALYIGDSTPHSLVVQMFNDTTATSITFSNVPVGWLPINVKRVMAATTCINIVAVF